MQGRGTRFKQLYIAKINEANYKKKMFTKIVPALGIQRRDLKEGENKIPKIYINLMYLICS